MKNLANEAKIIKAIILLPIIGVIITSFVLTNIFISSVHERQNKELQNIENKYIDNLKNKIKERINGLAHLLEDDYKKDIEKANHKIKDIVNIGYAKLEIIYNLNKDLPKKELYELINQELKDIRFFNNQGYYFIYTLEGQTISLPANEEFVGKNIKEYGDKKAHDIFLSFKKKLEKDKEAFHQWKWNKIGEKKRKEKLGFAKLFEPLNIYIGTAIYLEDVKETIGKEAISFLKDFNYQDDSYIFIIDSKGTSLNHRNSSIVGVPLFKLNKKVQENVNEIIKKAKNSEGDFIEYTQDKDILKREKLSKKISYVKYIPTLQWVIGTGLYTDNLQKEIRKKREVLEEALTHDIKKIVSASILVTFCIIILLIFLSEKLKNIFQYYSQTIEEANEKLLKLNNQLEEKVENQVSSIREKDAILNQQAKLAAMGEMLGNIAHQWRQPLSAISTLASGIRVRSELKIISEEQLDDELKRIVTSTKMLSKTIDDFRNFYSKNKETNNFTIENALKNVLSLIQINLDRNGIQLIQESDNTIIHSYENELIQVLLNILNNSKDALEDIKQEKYVFINSKQNDNFLSLEIYDNAGGISEDIIARVFEPYFTTKFKAQGTGIGLYMTKNIVESSLKGKIKVENKEFIYNEQKYKGALFKIELPLYI